jgi:hypothetical protein
VRSFRLSRSTEWVDFLNRKDVPDKNEYSDLELFEEVEENGKKKVRMFKKYRAARMGYRKILKHREKFPQFKELVR